MASETTPLLVQEQDLDCSHLCANLVPKQEIRWPTESLLILQHSTPLIGTYLLQYLYSLTIILFVAHLGTDALAAVSLGITTMNIIGFAIFEGMATALDTLCAQAYGSGNLKLVGLHTQRMIFFLLLVAMPIGAIWICSPWILGAIVPQKNLAVLAGSFLRFSLIGVPGYAVFEAGKRFMQAQGNFTAALVVLIVCAPVNLFLNWLLIVRLQYGVSGAALAAALTNSIRPLLLLFYILLFAPGTLKCWPGFGPPSLFRNWSPMISLSLSGATMTLAEWFSFEILTFSTSYLSTAHLAAQTFLSTASVLIWHIPFSASIAISTRVGTFIGRGAVASARTATKTYAILAVLIGLLDMALLVLVLRCIIAPYFVPDPVVRDLITYATPIVALFQFFDAMTCGVHGVMRGLGRQAIGGWATFCVNSIYAVPLALFLQLGPPGMGLRGLWIGLGSGLAVLTAVETLIMKSIDWQSSVEDAKRREEVVV